MLPLYLAWAFAAALLLVPGYLVARVIGTDRATSLALAPLLSMALFGALPIVYQKLPISCSWVTLAALPALVMAVVLAARAVRLRKGKAAQKPAAGKTDPAAQKPAAGEQDPAAQKPAPADERPVARAFLLALAVAVAVATLTCLYVYVRPLGAPDAFEQTFDNAWHLTHIHDFARTGNYSPFGTILYPSAWHALGAMAEVALGVATPTAENAANLAFISVAYPLGAVLLLRTLFPDKPRRWFVGAATCLAFAFFPWRIMLFGPLYPNMASFCLMPAETACFLALTGRAGSAARRRRAGILFVVGGAALALTQPNTIFSAGVFLLPWCVQRAGELARGTAASEHAAHGAPQAPHRLRATLVMALLTCVFVGAWYALARAPFMAATVNYYRDAALSVPRAVRFLMGFSFVWRHQQYLAGALVIAGGLTLLDKPGYRWIPVSYLLIGALYVAAIGLPEGDLKHVIAGFWYSDYYRLAATACVYAVPLLATGFDALANLVWRPFARRRADEEDVVRLEYGRTEGQKVAAVQKPAAGQKPAASEKPVASEKPAEGQESAAVQKPACAPSRAGRGAQMPAPLAAILLVAFMAVNVLPLPALLGMSPHDAFASVRGELRDLTSVGALTPEEEAFTEEAAQITGDAVVANVPYDGSVSSFATSDLNVLFTQYIFATDSNQPSVIVRMGLANVATDPAVQQAVRKLGVRYVIQLDHEPAAQPADELAVDGEGATLYDFTYNPASWAGINSIDESTPGFTLVLHEGDMYLYQIDDAA